MAKRKGPQKGTPMSEYVAARKAAQQYKVALKKPAGEGSRFAAIAKGAKARGARNPEAVAAMIGRKKYGKANFQKMALKGKKSKK